MKNVIQVLAYLVLALAAVGCSPRAHMLEPCIQYVPQQCHIDSLPSAFEELTPEERSTDWGKELYIGENFAWELDLYRAITAFKRAHILFPSCGEPLRDLQIDYDTFLCYYMGGRYQDALNIFEASPLANISSKFPPVHDFLIALFDSYMQTKQYAKAFRVLELLDSYDPDAGTRLRVWDSILAGDLCAAQGLAEDLCWGKEHVDTFASDYCCRKLSVTKAQTLNALLPGAGYYYVGQKKAALTSFVINTLFTAAAYAFFERGYWAAGLITTSLELGWYIGGINGAGLAAKHYNECLYNSLGKETMIKGQMFPILLFQTAF
jgi:tetratricopeptide (TPR) repeat protein